MSIDFYKRTSEQIRMRAAIFNPRLTRISTKQVLKELLSKGLIETEVIERKRYYRISKRGKDLIASFNFER
jgi:predicted transcriptional regulator